MIAAMSSTAAAQGLPLRVDPFARDREQRRSLIRAISSIVLSSGDRRAEEIVEASWPKDNLASMVVRSITKGAVVPATMGTSGLPAAVSVEVLPSLAPMSAAVRLFARCMKVNLDHVNQVSVPRGLAPTTPIFIAEGQPAPVFKLAFPDTLIGPVRKILVLAAVTGELENAGPTVASDVIARVLSEATTRSLDAVVFDSNPDDGISRPAGLLHGLAPITASTNTGSAAIAEDLGSLAGAIASNNVDADDMVIVANPKQATQIRFLAGPSFDNAVFSSSQIPDKRVIGIAASAVASAYSGVPTIEKSKNPALHFEDATPANIVSEAGTAAAPVMSAFQTDMIAIKVRANAAWSVVAPGVAYVDAVKW